MNEHQFKVGDRVTLTPLALSREGNQKFVDSTIVEHTVFGWRIRSVDGTMGVAYESELLPFEEPKQTHRFKVGDVVNWTKRDDSWQGVRVTECSFYGHEPCYNVEWWDRQHKRTGILMDTEVKLASTNHTHSAVIYFDDEGKDAVGYVINNQPVKLSGGVEINGFLILPLNSLKPVWVEEGNIIEEVSGDKKKLAEIKYLVRKIEKVFLTESYEDSTQGYIVEDYLNVIKDIINGEN